jgi:hypothetical protein
MGNGEKITGATRQKNQGERMESCMVCYINILALEFYV